MPPSPHLHPLTFIDRTVLPPDGGADYNRLIFEESPYLLQHADNPVDWYPWGDDAFAEARRRDRPIFLSIGYATCHWCHVMSHESFADLAVAELLNRHFVAIKVDREERPDIDRLYMNACQLISGSGGWPLTIFLTPDKSPFFAATYLPKESSGGRYGLLELLRQITRLWDTERNKILAGSNEIALALRRSATLATDGAAPLDERPLAAALRQFHHTFDQRYGGFGPAPKFPAPHQLALLLRLARRFADPAASRMAMTTMQAMARGGIYDQLSGGLHRYSVDERWHFPHFEKMLYDQALLILAALDGYQATGDNECAELATGLTDYLLGALSDAQGGFYCGEDADSAGSEGAYYLWSRAEIMSTLGDDEGELFCSCYGVVGTTVQPSVLHRQAQWTTLASNTGIPLATLNERLAQARRKLLAVREERPRPLLDDKIILGWNGLALAALARAGHVLGRADYDRRAAACATFLLNELRRPDGRLLRRWRRGNGAIPAYLEDYAALVWGLIELHQSTLTDEYLATALQLTDTTLALFLRDGQLVDSGHDGEQLPLPAVMLQDGALPSGQAMMVHNLLRLGRLGVRPDLEATGRTLLAAHLPHISRFPTAYAHWLTALDFALAPVTVGTLLLQPDCALPADWQRALRHRFAPHLLLLRRDHAQPAPQIQICRATSCLPPSADIDDLFSEHP